MVCGMAAGLGICAVPIMLAEIAPPHIRGRVGVLNQVGIVFGILSTQAVGMNYAAPREWRHVLSASASLGVIQLVLGFFTVDSPVWYKIRGKTEEAVRVAKRLWKDEPVVTDIEDLPLAEDATLDAREAGHIIQPLQNSESVVDVIMTMEYRKPLSIVALVMIAQQISGRSPSDYVRVFRVLNCVQVSTP
jgi:MFS family permease